MEKTINEVQVAKADVERSINDTVNTFLSETPGVLLEDIEVSTTHEFMDGRQSLIRVKINLKIK